MQRVNAWPRMVVIGFAPHGIADYTSPARLPEGLQGRPGRSPAARSAPAGRLSENPYYHPTSATGADGTFTLKLVHLGEQFIQVAPFWLEARGAPEAPPGL